MKIIISHMNTDFDALASMFAAKKLYPDAQVVISDKQNIPVRQFLNIYRDSLDLVQDHLIDWSRVTELILVDVASLSRISDHAEQLPKDDLQVTVFDHHPPVIGDVQKDAGTIEQVGAAVTLLIEEIRRKSLSITPFEATLFGLGIYTDTGSFTYDNTTARDLEAAAYLMNQGMNLDIVQRFSDEIFLPEQQALLDALFAASTTHYLNGLQIIVSTHKQKKFQKGLATLTQKLLEITDADAVLTVVNMRNRTFLVGRASSERIDLLPLLEKWQGGGHAQAGSATIKDTDEAVIASELVGQLDLIIKPATTASDMMTSPVKTIPPETTIEEAGRLMYRYGHSGFPVVENEKLIGIITRRDLEKANHHGLGHAPVKGYMTTQIISISPETTAEEIQKLIIEHNVGRLPVVASEKLIGIVSRTNVIEVLHKQSQKAGGSTSAGTELKEQLNDEMKSQLPKEIYNLLQDISKVSNQLEEPVYLIGGIVRDIFLKRENDDVDIVVEGDGVAFAKRLQQDYGGELITHESFGTATWTHPMGLEVDVATSRLEYYDHPAALPDIETSTLKEDLSRRDFTINAMAINLTGESFGELVDPFRGQTDLRDKKITILHNISYVEDPTRIFRGVRFEARFGFKMDQQTEKLALQSIDRVKELSAHRIVEEMIKLFAEGHSTEIIARLFELKFWQQFSVSKASCEPSLQHAKQLENLYTNHESLKNLDGEPSWFSLFLIPFYQEGIIEQAKQFSLTKPNAKILQEITSLQAFKHWQQIKQIGEYHRFLKDYTDASILFIIANISLAEKPAILEYITRRNKLPVFLTGADLIKRGLKPSALFSELLLDLDVAVLNQEVQTKEEAVDWLEERIHLKG